MRKIFEITINKIEGARGLVAELHVVTARDADFAMAFVFVGLDAY